MNKYEFVISAKDKTAQAFASINSGLGTVRKNAGSAALAISGTTAAFTAIANSSIRNARDLDSMAKVAGYSVEEFQALSFAFENFNISQEKFSDISKDVQDKLGDFIATGGGEFKDFFEQIAPQVGLTAESLKDLAGVDVLIAVKNAMDDANISAKEQVFYMESIANDATLLLPALENNGAAIKNLAGEYEDLNLAISQTEIDKIKELAIEVEKLESASSKFRDSLVSNLAEPLADIVDDVHDFYNDAVVYLERDFIEIHKWTNQAAIGFYKFQKAIGMDIDDAELQKIIAQTEYLSTQYDKLTKKINGEPIAYEFGYGETDIETLFEGLNTTTGVSLDVKATPEVKPAEIKSTVDEDKVDARNQHLIDSTTAAFAAIHEENLRFAGLDAEIEKERYAAQVEKMQMEMDLLERKGLLTQQIKDQYRSAEIEALENHQSRLLEITEDSDYWQRWLNSAEINLETFSEISGETINTFSRQFGDAFESVVLDSENLNDVWKGLLKGLTRSTINALGQMGAQWLAYQAVQLAVGKTTSASSALSMSANAQASSLMAGINAFSSTAAIPLVGPFAAPGAMAAALAATQPLAAGVASAAMAGLASFDGGGYTGDGARSGGLDGKGGYLAMLHPQEYVTDFTKGQRLGGQQQQTNVYNNYQEIYNVSAMDAKSFDRWSRDKGESMAKALARYERRG